MNDFQRLLNHANKNREKNSKEMATAQNELSDRKTRELQRLQREIERKKLEQKKKQLEIEKAQRLRIEESRKQFQIPKVKSKEPTVSSDQIAAFKAKKEVERIENEKQRLKEKERLAELRLQAHGGRANKKIARHFGIDPVSMQIRYGNDHEHIEKLQKRNVREQEEMDQLTESLRGGVYKALQQKKKVESIIENKPSGARPIGTSKANSLAGMSSRHANNKDRFSPPRNPKKLLESEKKTGKSAMKRPPPPPIDFNQLMAIASGKAKVPEDDLPTSSKMNPQKSKNASPKLPVQSKHNKKDFEARKFDNHQERTTISNILPLKKPRLEYLEKYDEPKSKPNRIATKARDPPKVEVAGDRKIPTQTSLPTSSSQKRYLPGDLRYQPEQNEQPLEITRPMFNKIPQKTKCVDRRMATSSSKRPHIEKEYPSIYKPSNQKHQDPLKRDRPQPQAANRPNRPMAPSIDERKQIEARRREMERQRQRREQYDSMSLLERERMRDAERRRTSMGYGRDEVDEWQDELEEDDEYDSDLDDFIDDSVQEDERLTRRELEETMRSINKNYDKNLWRARERMIDERQMEANFKQVDLEERRSRRMGLMEDILEAKKGNSLTL